MRNASLLPARFPLAKLTTFALASALALTAPHASAQTQITYQPTEASLATHPLPDWYSDAKLGIFIHWGLYSVPGWAPVSHTDHDFASNDYITNDPYAEWYYNTMRVPNSPTQKYHREHYGNADYYSFTKTFNDESAKWSPDQWSKIFSDAGARYIVLTTKHHEGFTLWPSQVPNPNQQGLHATRDIVGELTTSARKAGLRMGLYYSGGYDWTFNRGPILRDSDYESVKPQMKAYGDYADAQAEELVAKYHPDVLWNDIDWPKSGNALKVIADYYNAVPEGVVDDRFGIKHTDFTSPEYAKMDEIRAKKWEECRGLGASFGFNRAEGEAETIAPDKLIALLVDIVSKNGNLLLDVGPMPDGTIPAVQMDRLIKLGAWMKQNGEAIYGTRPWKRAEGKTTSGIDLRFTQKATTLYAILLAKPAEKSITIKELTPAANAKLHLLGSSESLKWQQRGNDVEIMLPQQLPGNYAWTLAFSE